jgi:hypothetical protein
MTKIKTKNEVFAGLGKEETSTATINTINNNNIIDLPAKNY